MSGFFDLPKKENINRIKGKPASCASCGLYLHAKSPRMEPFGNFKKGILNIGEAPGEIEDSRGKHWQGRAGRLLQKTYKKFGIDVFEDCLNINAVNCRPMDTAGDNREPTPHEIACCRSRVWQIIEEKKPKIIIALGSMGITSLLGHRWKKNLGGITKWRGWRIPDRDMKGWLCPTFHPSYINRLQTDEANTIWQQDLSAAFSMLKKPYPIQEDDTKCVHILDSPEDLPPFPDVVAFDYETTGLKPQAKGHRIVCASVAYNANASYVFMMPSSLAKRKKFLDMLKDSHIRKMAHNIKFEESWSFIRGRAHIHSWDWDSMLAAHILDNRPGITSLKFQTYVNQGVVDYDSAISSYLKGTEQKNANSHNRIFELLEKPGGKKKLLLYCALDSLYTYRLAMQQKKEMRY